MVMGCSFLDDAKADLKKKADELKELISKDGFDKEIVKTKTKELSTELQTKGAEMYKKAADEVKKEEAAKGTDSPKEEKEPKAAEGEVVDDKDKKKK